MNSTTWTNIVATTAAFGARLLADMKSVRPPSPSPANTPSWTDIFTAATALVALLVAAWSLGVSRDAHKLAKSQDERRRPRLTPYLEDCHLTVLPDDAGRCYAFHLKISNRSDADNALADLSLHLTYRRGNARLTAKLPVSEGPRTGILAVPQKIAAHDTVSGWAHFELDADLFAGAAIEAYAVVITDSHGETSQVAPQIIRERSHA